MDFNIVEGNKIPLEQKKKYRLAGYGFLVLNIFYLVFALVFLPPFHIEATIIISIVVFLALIVLLTVFICRGQKRLVQILAVLYGARSLFAIYTLAMGEFFAAVPYFLPCLLVTFDLLARAGWNWP